MNKQRSLILALFVSLAVSPVTAQTTTYIPYRTVPIPGPIFPSAMVQCEAEQCTRGGGGAVWVFDGSHGQAMWHYGAIANLTIRQFDGQTISIHREDPNPSYSSPRFADPKKRSDGVFFADYVGTIHGNRIDGTVVWNDGGRGTWYATIPENLCQPLAQCPLDLSQMMQLGQNAARAKEYTSALHCFLIGAIQGNSDGQSLAGLMLRDGQGAPPNEAAAFSLLQKGAEQGNYNGELGLANMYEVGLGTPKNPERAALWKGRAAAQLQQAQAAQAQTRATEAQRDAGIAVGALLFLGIAAALVADSDSSHSDSSSNQSLPNLNQQMQRRRDFDYWSNGGSNISAPSGYKCQSGGC